MFLTLQSANNYFSHQNMCYICLESTYLLLVELDNPYSLVYCHMLECYSLQKSTYNRQQRISFIHPSDEFFDILFLMPPYWLLLVFFFQSYEMRHKISQYCFDQLYLTAKRISGKMARFMASNMWKINPRALPSSPFFAQNDFFHRFLRQILKVVC